jgi:3-hydroxybutyryl-CoA dehydratase
MSDFIDGDNHAVSAVRPRAELFATDFDELRGGECFVSRARTITTADVDLFAALTGDRHPQHLDAEWAAAGRFGGRIAHGMLVFSFAVGLLPLDPERILALRRVKDAVFKRPVRLDDSIRVEARIDSARPLDDETGLVTCEWRILNQADALVLRTMVEVLWRRGGARPDASTDGDGYLDALPRGVLPL